MHRTTVIDSHTGGEPTRVVVSGGPDLGPGPLADRARRFRGEFDSFRSRVVNEPRGSDVLVGALLCEPTDPACAAGVIFFNNVGVLGMCGHGTIGLAVTLAHLGRITPGEHRIETPVGVVTAVLHDAHRVTVRNVPSYRHRTGVTVDVPGLGAVTGDVAWGGNWFFLVANYPEALTVANAERLTDASWRIRRALVANGVTGANGGEIDHVELFGPPLDAANHGRNFVLCPGGAYDRSPCGTGTSAKLACLFADGKLKPGDVWRQESITGSLFEGTVAPTGDPGVVVPSITGTAFVTAEATLLADPADPLRDGIRG
ncbi:hydroxyproline-2-epimerase : Putative proline racemase OS=Acidobacterium capsulatum (strain ATCC 51196 / DSM 11244 / JCM 7670) GN=ACP_3275 PE=4 SV=1: Pro_racemase [Gemmataceae bacterium]|nr:hydroxyproline-2-epimerase : Putative proline racemase OS=Acidobacterium capsulatum (strain ATCC 51196 / DSM 11244 / JCM 7670) GN=ACP_3275 PE=4 SV=1: Pro_racemase [Gemmataceae bacterium]VTU00738.1 hydroxyproline-2-epimerase : Putative proline racemase OS=Acidobacterium capsulatum (strain ATCC 51196 / DSM 11244 / JCM 7670) GN=ACP_3275 PE=4 SV=1: Pro_racemase [Gemmataceae bacterium]